ncbi:MAG: Gfo/Idh/MocA family oxidoreductase [Planctomycetota bacterium]|nr:Gfo/Idh/MocA family oxidoreductase [Planctomycetota bacterium]
MSKQSALNRRDFLRRGAAAAAAAVAFPTIIPASALGDDGKPAPSNRIVMGCIGVGGQGGSNMGNFLGQPSCQVVAIADVDKNNANSNRDRVNNQYKNKDCKAYYDFRELCARDDIDAVMMATPDHWHAVVALTAVRSGKDVYGEKPFTHDLREGRALANAVQQYGRVWQTGSWQRRGGGSEQFVAPPPNLDYDFWVGPSPWAPYSKDRTHWNWRWQLDYGGGQMMDWIGHHGDIAQWGLGTEYTGPIEIEGKAEFPTKGLWNAPTSYKAFAKFANGVTMIIANDQQTSKGMGAKWIGDKGWVWVDRGGFDAEPKSLLKEVIRPDEINLYRSKDHWGNFLECVKSRRLTITPAEVAHRSASLGHLAMVAILVGRKIKFDPDKEEIIGDPTANALLGRAKREPWRL